MNNIMFSSTNQKYRNPTGAVPCGTCIHFKIFIPKSLQCSDARLIVKTDSSGQLAEYRLLSCEIYKDNSEIWECDLPVMGIGLYFYKFEIKTKDKRITLSRGLLGQAVIEQRACYFDEGGPAWQITCYKPGFKTPEWLNGAVMYQIFPDRFFCSGMPKQNVPTDRKMHSHWAEMMDWQPDKEGKFTNCDYFGGDLPGITQKLEFLKELGVTCVYINPIFEAHSNHRYNTADYSKIDPLLGTQEDFICLCTAAQSRGIKVILDGVFSHAGSDSIYFNRQGRYPLAGAYNTKDSPYFNWFKFTNWPNEYESWWGFESLPEIKETQMNYNEYINGKEGIAKKWLRLGASGWRLDVADELPDLFLERFRKAVKEQDPDAVIIGEVWEDASNKESYGRRRKYLLGEQLDSAMNYPFREVILGFLGGVHGGKATIDAIVQILENYPKSVIDTLMNIISTHDTPRALSLLGGEPLKKHDRLWQSGQKLSSEQKERGIRLMMLASAMQYTLPGVPCIYYGDEAGMEGYHDPFCRGTYPWGSEDQDLIAWYAKLGKFRGECSAFKGGDFIPAVWRKHIISYIRVSEECSVFCAFNAGDKSQQLKLPFNCIECPSLTLGATATGNMLKLEPFSCALFKSVAR